MSLVEIPRSLVSLALCGSLFGCVLGGAQDEDATLSENALCKVRRDGEVVCKGSGAGTGASGATGTSSGAGAEGGVGASGGNGAAGGSGGSGGGGGAGGANGIAYGAPGGGSPSGDAGCSVETSTPNAAIDTASPGDVVCVTGGSHDALTVAKAITVRAIGETFVDGIHVSGSGVTIDGFTVVGSGVSGAGVYVTGSGHAILNNRIDTDLTDYGIRLQGADHTLVRNNTVTRVLHWGIDARGDFNELSRNNIYDLRRLVCEASDCADVDGVKFHGSDLVIRENYIHDINQYASAYEDDPPHVDCFQTHDKSGYPTFRVLVERNYCVRVSRQCLIAEHETVGDLVFRNNVCETHDNQNINVKRSLGGDVWIYNNYIAGSPGKAIYTSSGSANGDPAEVYVVNNFARSNPGDGMTLVSGPTTVTANNVLVEEDSPFVNVPGFDSGGNTSYPEHEPSDFDPAGPRGFVLSTVELNGSIAVPALPSWVGALGADDLDIDGEVRVVGSAAEIGPFEQQ